MPELKNYRIFISHAWRYDDDYRRMENLLKAASLFEYSSHSVPRHDPLKGGSDIELEEQLRNQISGTNAVLILAGMYVNYSKWIQTEIDIAKAMDKPIIGIEPWGSTRIPVQVQSVAKEMICWNTSSVVSAIRKWAK